MNKTLLNTSAIIMLIIALASAGAYDAINYVKVIRSDNQPMRKLGPTFCLQCHTDAKTLRAMRDKRGDFMVYHPSKNSGNELRSYKHDSKSW